MQTRQRAKRGDRLIAAHVVVFAFLFLALCVTAAGTARFAVALGYSEWVGYAVGGVLEVGKWVLPILVMSLWHARPRVLACRVLACLIGTACLGLVTYSALATHAMVSSAIASRERMGTRHMETRSATQSELASVERQLAAISVPQPRPVTTVRQALAAEKVPPGIWRDSRECQSIRESRHFQKACHKVLQLRRELAAAEDHERLGSRARALRETLAAAPIVATSDPLSEAFKATLGRRLPIEGPAGVARLLTIVVEIMSSCGPAALRARVLPGEDAAQPRAPAAGEVPPNPRTPRTGKLPAPERGAALASKVPAGPRKSRARRRAEARTGSRDAARSPTGAGRRQQACRSRPSFPGPFIADRPASPAVGRRRRTSRRQSIGSRGWRACACNVADFVRECLERAEGASTSAAALRMAYPRWCIARGEKPVSGHRLGSELKKLGFGKWKSNGRIRYRDLRLRA